MKSIEIDGQKINLQMWDTAGQERFRTIGPHFYRNAHAAILVFDITDGETYRNVKRYLINTIKHFTWNHGLHSVLEQIWIKDPYLLLDQRLPQHESLHPIGLKSSRIEIPHIGFHYIDFSKTALQ